MTDEIVESEDTGKDDAGKNEIATIDSLGGHEVTKYDESMFDSVSKSGDYLPRLQLMTANSKKCKAGEFAVNHYALVRDQKHDDLGEECDVLVVNWRPKALDTGGEQVIAAYDPNDNQFQEIQRRAGVKDSGCMFGPEFLVWIPEINKFATFFMGSASARRESPSVKARMKGFCTLKSHLIKTTKYSWFAPEAIQCSTPYELTFTEGDLEKEVEKFLNPPKTEVEVVNDEEEDGEGRAR